MSRRAKSFLAGSIVLSGLTVWGVHFMQIKERETMYKGVERDEARQAAKRAARQADLERNQEREAQFQQMQPTRNYPHVRSVVEEGQSMISGLLTKAQNATSSATGADVGGSREAEDRAYITGRWAMNGLEVGAVAASPLYLLNSLRKGSFTFRRMVRANWTTPLLFSLGGALSGAAYSATLPSARASSTSTSYRLNHSTVRRDDLYLIGGVIGALLTPAIFLRSAGLVNGALGGGLGLGGSGAMLWDVARKVGQGEVDGEEVRKEVGGIAEKAKGMAKDAESKVKGK